MNIRRAIAAARFYPSEAEACRREIAAFAGDREPVPAIGAIAPHAGWMYSGRLAALAIRSLAASAPETVVLFGAAHVRMNSVATAFDRGAWETPLGLAAVDEELAAALVADCTDCTADAAMHAQEHSIEVQVPILKYYRPGARIVPVMVEPDVKAAAFGRASAAACARLGRRAAFLASTDLTHYGPRFGFEPAGRGGAGLRWAKEVNDRRFVAAVAALDAEAVVREAATNRNACGAGAVAALMGAMEHCGMSAYVELERTTSAEVEGSGYKTHSVGYEAGVFVRPEEKTRFT